MRLTFTSEAIFLISLKEFAGVRNVTSENKEKLLSQRVITMKRRNILELLG